MNDLKKKQAEKYLEEARLNITAAEAIFEQAKETEKDLWAQVVKNAYDAIESAVSSFLAFREIEIPRAHSLKITKFLENVDSSEKEELTSTLLEHVGKRQNSRYVDIVGEEVKIPHEIFDKQDAESALKDARKIIKFVEKQSTNNLEEEQNNYK